MELCTPYLLVNLVIFIAGLWILIKGSDLFIDSAADIARQYHVSELAIGLTLVSIGTSLPELASSVYAAFCNQPEFIVGNIVGSITTNITLILGAAALVGGTMIFPRQLLTRDGVIMMTVFLVTVVVTYLCRVADPAGEMVPGLNRICGALLFGAAVWYCVHLLKSSGEKPPEPESTDELPPPHCVRTLPVCYLVLILGLGMVLLGSKMLLDTVVWGARALQVSTMVISVTIVAFGTSVPELAVTIAGVVKKRHELAIGNIIGSCTFNILMIFGACALIRPLAIAGWTGAINLGVMCLSGAVLLLCMLNNRLTRLHGIFLLAIYFGFLIYNCREFLGF